MVYSGSYTKEKMKSFKDLYACHAPLQGSDCCHFVCEKQAFFHNSGTYSSH